MSTRVYAHDLKKGDVLADGDVVHSVRESPLKSKYPKIEIITRSGLARQFEYHQMVDIKPEPRGDIHREKFEGPTVTAEILDIDTLRNDPTFAHHLLMMMMASIRSAAGMDESSISQYVVSLSAVLDEAPPANSEEDQ